jgi:hypothetical protein
VYKRQVVSSSACSIYLAPANTGDSAAYSGTTVPSGKTSVDQALVETCEIFAPPIAMTATTFTPCKKAGSTPITTSTTTTTLVVNVELFAGWNLIGNGYSGVIDVVSVFSDKSLVTSVWKWLADKAMWAFYAPSMNQTQLQTYTQNKNYEVLTLINAGEGFWVNASSAWTLRLDKTGKSPVRSDSFVQYGSMALPQGWSLIAVGDKPTPSGFNLALSSTPPATGVPTINFTSLWAWDATQTSWQFFAPSLQANGTLESYIQSKQYKSFGSNSLSAATGFWINKP